MEFRSSEISLESRRLFQPTPLFRAKFLLLLQGHMVVETDRFEMSDLSIEIGGKGNKRKSSFFRDNDSDWLAHVELQPMTFKPRV